MAGNTGTWFDSGMGLLGVAVGYIDTTIANHQVLVDTTVNTATGIAIILGGYWLSKQAIRLAKSGWRKTKRAYHAVTQLPIIRRAHGVVMAKWERSYLADILHDAIFQKYMDGKITERQYKRFTKQVGEGLKLPDMFPRKIHREALKNYFANRKPLAGPVKTIPGGPPALHIPVVEQESNVISSSKFMNRLKARVA